MSNRISVLITYFNEKSLLTECLISVQHQAVHEVIIYDDASNHPAANFIPTDFTGELQIIRNAVNKGPGYGRTQLLHKAKGDYVHFHDADDLFAPTWGASVLQAIHDTQADVILTGIQSINETGHLLSEDVMEIQKTISGQVDLVKIGLAGSILVPSTTFKRALGLKVGGYEPREVLVQSEDFHFHLKLGLQNPSIVVISEPLIIQRIRSNSHSHSAGLLVCCQAAIKALNLLKPELIQNYSKELAEAYVRIGHQLFVLGDRPSARLAFQSAKKLHPVSFSNRSTAFAITSKLLGIELAERLSLFFQKIKRALLALV